MGGSNNITQSGSVSQFVTKAGFAQVVPNPNNFSSSVLVQKNSTFHAVLFPIAFGTVNYLAYLPVGAIMDSITFTATAAWTSGATFRIGGGNSAVTAPGAPTVTPTGTTGSTSYSYKAVAYVGSFSVASTAGSTTTGNASLSATNFNALSVTAVTNATSYAWYRTVGGATVGFIGNSTTPTFSDTGLVANVFLLAPTSGDNLGDTATSANLISTSLQATSNAPIQGAAGVVPSVQQIVLSLTGTTATAGTGFVAVSYYNTLTAPSQA